MWSAFAIKGKAQRSSSKKDILMQPLTGIDTISKNSFLENPSMNLTIIRR
jgi:hypothetical protein